MKFMLEFECGEKTCASKESTFCRFIGSTHFGQIPICQLFRDHKGNYIILETTEPHGAGWALRCKQCLEKTVRTE